MLFRSLISFTKTDFIFFVSSSNIRRFKEHDYVKKYIETANIKFDETKPKECHKVMADYYKKLTNSEYYIHHFTIKKGANYWGLIFCSNHSLGMEKFLKVCWKNDTLSGEANFNIDNNWEEGTLFYNSESNVKKDIVSKEIKQLILSGEISDNITGLKYAMHKGCEPKLFTETVKLLEENNLIERFGELNYQSSNVHKAKVYNIKKV